MILCIGEILVDMIAQENNGSISYLRKAGGAPFNVACAISKLGIDSTFVGSVGDDTIGKFLCSFIKKQNLKDYYIEENKNRNTTLAFVDLDEYGERSFCFYRKNTADYILPDIKEEMLDAAHIIHVGSLMLSHQEGIEYAKNIIAKAHSKNKLVSFDINFRTDIFENLEHAIKNYKDILELADIVKFSEDEVEIFGNEYVNSLKDKLVCISLGKDGSKYFYNEISNTIPSIKVKPVDTTGAGDAFYAGILSQIDGLTKTDWKKEKLDYAFLFGNICGALNTLGKGAIDNLPTKDEILKRI